MKLSKDENEVVQHTQAQQLSSQILAKLATIYRLNFLLMKLIIWLYVSPIFFKNPQAATRFQKESSTLIII